MITAIAVDDEPIALSIVENFCQRIPGIRYLGGFTNPFEAWAKLQKENIELIFLDIKMPSINGIEWAKSIPNPPVIIFTTAYSEHAVESFDVEPIDYLLKPFSFERFQKAVDKAENLLQLKSKDKNTVLFIKSGQDHIKVNTADILFIQSAGNYVQFVLRSRKIISRSTLRDVESNLPTGQFTRVHRSYIISIAAVSGFDRQFVYIGDSQIPVGADYLSNLSNILGIE